MDNDLDYPDVVFVHQGTAEQDAAHFGTFGDRARTIADPHGEVFAAFAVRRGGVREMFGLRAWQRGIQAFLKGHFIGRKVGDPWTLPTVVAIQDKHVVWEHLGAHAGDHPDVRRIPALALPGA